MPKQPSSSKLGLGARVTYDRVLERQFVEVPRCPKDIDESETISLRSLHEMRVFVSKVASLRDTLYHWERRWVSCAVVNGEGVLVGYRTLQNGTTHVDSEGCRVWVASSTTRCAVVSFSLHRKPVFVPLDALQPRS